MQRTILKTSSSKNNNKKVAAATKQQQLHYERAPGNKFVLIATNQTECQLLNSNWPKKTVSKSTTTTTIHFTNLFSYSLSLSSGNSIQTKIKCSLLLSALHILSERSFCSLVVALFLNTHT